MRHWKAILSAVAFIGFGSAHAGIQVEVKPGALNRVSFNTPFESIVLSPGAPLVSEPTQMGGSRTLVMQIGDRAEEPFQMVAQLTDGTVLEFELTPNSDARPLAWDQPAQSADRLPNDHPARRPIQRPTDSWIRDIFHEVVQGRTPDGFNQIQPPAPGQIGSLMARYIAAFRNESHVLLAMSLHSNEPQWIAPQDLYAPGVQAVLVDGDRVGVHDAPVAYILMRAE